MTNKINAEMHKCIDNCMACHSICMETINHCLELGGDHADADHIQILMDCAQICQTNADFMLRASDLHGNTSNVCEKACKRCAEECVEIGKDDDLMKRCAETCDVCAQSCSKMANH